MGLCSAGAALRLFENSNSSAENGISHITLHP